MPTTQQHIRVFELTDLALKEKPASACLLLFVDQFEELFTVLAEEHHAGFIALLVDAAQRERVRIVLTMRADFYHRCLDHPALANLLNEGTFALMSGPRRRAQTATPPGGARRLLGLLSGLRARGVSQSRHLRRPERQSGFSVGLRVPHLNGCSLSGRVSGHKRA